MRLRCVRGLTAFAVKGLASRLAVRGLTTFAVRGLTMFAGKGLVCRLAVRITHTPKHPYNPPKGALDATEGSP